MISPFEQAYPRMRDRRTFEEIRDPYITPNILRELIGHYLAIHQREAKNICEQDHRFCVILA